jgi:hypothetical protein
MEFTINNKMDYDDVEHVYHAMFSAFHPEIVEQEDMEEEAGFEANFDFICLWRMFLKCAGWTEEEYFEYGDDELELAELVAADDKSKAN